MAEPNVTKVVLLGVKAMAREFKALVDQRLLAEYTSDDALKDARGVRREARRMLEDVRRAARG